MLRLVLILTLAPVPAFAQDFVRITDKSQFVAAVQGRSLTTTAIRLNVKPDGLIEGRAFGTGVTGTWTWTDGFFCRTLDTATKDFPLNCQQVETDGATIRFTADKGTGDIANLRIK
jgi:hypothetical protein